nr:unnamed protein product [Callosobruchus analis]
MPESCCILNDDKSPVSDTCTTSPNESNSYYMQVRVSIMLHVFILLQIFYVYKTWFMDIEITIDVNEIKKYENL